MKFIGVSVSNCFARKDKNRTDISLFETYISAQTQME